MPFMNFVNSEDFPSIYKLIAVLSILYSKQTGTKTKKSHKETIHRQIIWMFTLFSISFIIYPFRHWGEMLYSKVEMQAFGTASVAVALYSLVIKRTQWLGQE